MTQPSLKIRAFNTLRSLPGASFWIFALKEAWAALFGGLMLLAIVLTTVFDLPYLSQYDWLFLAALLIQAGMLVFKLEKPYELITIILFHLVGLGMELFKTSGAIGSWSYPGDAVIRLAGVPLFSGFMYAAVGSYMARSWRVFNLTFMHYPKRWATAILAVAIYINFFTHHFIYDFRLFLFAAVVVLYRKTWVTFTVNQKVRRMPLLVSFVLIALFIWIAENIGTFTKVWLYPNQIVEWNLVSFGKLGSWLLLMVISFIMVDITYYLRSKLK
ncbi:MAG TPA: DUF817 domain-containing protein [Candidatus Saccharimonadales bacterium]|nr:DUF817 domain-containing protein [Candidatus Saccharimonadales bacterium]